MDTPNGGKVPGIKVKTYSIRKAGLRGMMLHLPASWTNDIGLKPGDRLDVYRDTEDRLIIVPTKRADTP